jgi:NAD(P)-dependent dehydrogenase (short-subunit alcohol dehydrogenase family)
MTEPVPAHQRYQPAPADLRGRVIAITGAGDGIGRAVALAAAAQGASVVLIGRGTAKLEAVHAAIPEPQRAAASIALLDLDKAVAKDYDQLADALLARYGRLDALLHNAGILGTLAPIETYDVPTWCRVLHVNLTAAFALTQVLLPALRAASDASVVFTSSGVARKPRAYWGAYAVSKTGIEVLARLLAEEFEHNGNPRFNVLNPGPVRTRMRRQAFPAEDPQTLPAPEQIVAPYLWLLGGASRGINGQSLDCQPPRSAPSPGSAS